jgi:hypothetical protein
MSPPSELGEDREALIEQVTSAYRALDPFTQLPRFHPAFHDLDEEARAEAHERTLVARALEAALDPDGLSTTARAVLARLRG